MQPLAFALEEFRHVGVGARRLEQLDLTLAYREERGADALVFDGVESVDVEAEDVPVELERLVEVVDGYADVVDLVDHGPSLYIPSRSRQADMTSACSVSWATPPAGLASR